MCEFCTQHGEGRKWYLQMKNYSDVLLHEELSNRQREIVQANSRLEWNQRFFEDFVMWCLPGNLSEPGHNVAAQARQRGLETYQQ